MSASTSEHILASVYASVSRCRNSKAKVFSNKYHPTDNFHSATPQSRYQTTMTGRLESERGDTSGIEMSVHRRVSSLLQSIYSCADVCLSGVDSELLRPSGSTAKCCMGAVGLGGIDGCLGVLEGWRYVCMSLKQLFPQSNDYLCSLCLFYGRT